MKEQDFKYYIAIEMHDGHREVFGFKTKIAANAFVEDCKEKNLLKNYVIGSKNETSKKRKTK